METIYSKATTAINTEINIYLDLINQTNSFKELKTEIFNNKEFAEMFAYGIGTTIDFLRSDYKEYLINEYKRKSALKFDIENAVTYGVYKIVREYVIELYNGANNVTSGFKKFNEQIILDNPEMLPIFQNLLGYSRAQLIKKVGSISDTRISKPGAKKISELLTDQIIKKTVDKNITLQRLEITIEGIVRDLVGRVLFEQVVANALTRAQVPYLREGDYSRLTGVVYDNRADFVVPNEKDPIAFIEVRKSSSRHASLYAKDKMFSAINWKGKHKKVIGVIIVEGDWTQATLQTMSSIFDYVVPLEKSNELASILKKAVDGDESILKWLIEFSISKSQKFK
ncbi:hypothetical protein JET18_14600 [Chryseobacterium sp. L7]|uniref:Uncharacterized protein n=1 Tax=Chryseobacterium endalhagicum TaxID=2797638 RepID=A0ABS1QHJ3_9FLAO|nr:hypothetical protein [Chryseobacterium endalhagicum]MBL1222078.1 hypothetical protein [Chryseobacterium endalhagicum]